MDRVIIKFSGPALAPQDVPLRPPSPPKRAAGDARQEEVIETNRIRGSRERKRRFSRGKSAHSERILQNRRAHRIRRKIEPCVETSRVQCGSCWSEQLLRKETIYPHLTLPQMPRPDIVLQVAKTGVTFDLDINCECPPPQNILP